MPQECFVWQHNEIYSNNNNVFSSERQDYCIKTPFPERRKDIVCPQFQGPVGTGGRHGRRQPQSPPGELDL